MKMTYLRWIAFCCTIVTGVMALSSLSLASNTQDKPGALFTQLAQTASITTNPHHPDWKTLTLKGVSPKTVWFTERPHRLSGQVTTQQFVNQWAKGPNNFEENNPNASMVYILDNKRPATHKIAVIQLSNPIYNPKTHDLSYRFCHVGPMLISSSHIQEVALFIDNWGWPFNE
jgi:hypothetical protein